MRKTGFPHYGWAVLAMGTLAIFAALGLARFGYRNCSTGRMTQGIYILDFSISRILIK